MLRRIILLFITFIAALPSFGAIRGTVMTIDGAPISGARVEASLPETRDARLDRYLAESPRRPAIASATTDVAGTFTLDVKKVSAVDVSVDKSGYEPITILLGGDEDAGAIPLRPAPMSSGLVTGNGKPLANARLVFRNFTGEFVAVTDAEGRYSAPDPRAWRANVVIYHRDFAPLTDGLTDRKNLNFQLSPGSAVTGRVVGEDGTTPIAGAIVRVGSKRVATADDGSFSVEHVPQRRPSITVESGNLVGSDSGEKRNVRIRLTRAAAVSGVIRDAKTQRPLSGALVTLGAPGFLGSDEGLSAVTDTRGAFSFKRSAGRSQLGASFPNYSFSFVDVDARAGENVVRNLSGLLNATISGSVIDEARKVVAAARVGAASMTEPRGFNFRMMNIMEQPVAYSAPDGRYVVRNVPPEEQIEVSAVRKGIPAGTAGPFKLASGELKRGVTIVLPRGITLTGKVIDRDGRPIDGVVIILYPAEEAAGGPMRRVIMRGRPGSERDTNVETKADGTFVLQLKPGSYGFTFQRAGFAGKHVRGITVTADPEPLEVTLDRGVEIAGKVVRSDGSGVPDVNIVLMSEIPRSEPVLTAPDGSFSVSDLSPGPVMLIAMKSEEFIRETRNVSAPASNVVIEVAPGGRIEGRVVDKSGRPVSQYRISAANEMGGGGMMFRGPSMNKSFDSEDGSFIFENVPLGRIDLTVEAAGFVTGRSAGLVVEEGKLLKNIEIVLEPGVRLHGKVTGPDGSPLAGAMIREETNTSPPITRSDAAPRSTSDGAGEYMLEGMGLGEKSVVFERDGYLTERKTVNLSGKEVRLDVRLGRGKEVAGTVVDEQWMPVANANVTAVSGVQDAGTRSSRTGSNGVFRFEGLPAGRYTFRAGKTGYVSGEARDIDLDAATAGVRITLSSGGVIFGRVQYLTAEEGVTATVTAVGPANRRASAPIRQDGTYRIEGAPTGTVRVSASSGRFPSFKTSPAKDVEVAPGAEVQLDLEFASDLVVSGRVTRQGKPMDNAMVSFNPSDTRVQTRAATRTVSDGSYEINGLEPGLYSVDVLDWQRSGSYRTNYEVNGSGTFDIEMRGSQVRGRVLDADSGEPVAEATVVLQKPDDQPAFFGPQSAAVTDNAGNFVFDTVSPGNYRARAQKERYGQAIVDVVVSENQEREVELRLSRIDGVRLRVVDARDGRALSPFIWIRDQQGRNAYEGSPRPNSDGVLMVPLAPGGYQATISANGYAARTVSVVAPSQELQIALTPGGSIVIQSGQSERETAKLMTPTGNAYQRSPWVKAEFMLPPGTTTLDHLVPGPYVLQLLDNRGNVKSSFSVTVVEGQIARLEI